MKTLLAGFGASLLIISIAWGSSIIQSAAPTEACLTQADVVRHQDRSRTGISLTCTPAIAQQNAVQ